MTVYIDDMYLYPMGRFGRMKMSHMMADTAEELHAMAKAIGVQRKWAQNEKWGKGFLHYDIAMSARKKAATLGATQITLREMSAMAMKWRTITATEMARCNNCKHIVEQLWLFGKQ